MSNRLLRVMLRQAKAIAAGRPSEEQSDAELLRRFVEVRDETAFSMVLHRHGSMVWAVCRQMLMHPTDADDAFQAVFLVLIQSGPKLIRVKSLGGWLHSVAVRICLKARRTTARRKRRERSNAKSEGVVPIPHWDDLHAAVHEEVERLPESLRTAFVLCELQGVRQTEVAEQLGWKLGTVSGRLTRARQLLLKKLTARGLTPLVAVGTVSVGGVALGGIPSSLANGVFALLRNGANGSDVSSTVLELARGATEGLMSKFKLTVGSVMAVTGLTVALGTGWLPNADAQRPTKTPPAAPPGAGYGAGSPTLPPPGADTAPATVPVPTPASRNAGNVTKTTSPATPRYEHVMIDTPNTRDAAVKLLQKQEKNGWEYCGVVQHSFDQMQAYNVMVFKRLKGTASPLSTSFNLPALAPDPVGVSGDAVMPAPNTQTLPSPVPATYPTPSGSLPAREPVPALIPSASSIPPSDLVPLTSPIGPTLATIPRLNPESVSPNIPASTNSRTSPAKSSGEVLIIRLKSLAATEAQKLIVPILGDDYKERGGAVDLVAIPDSSTVVLYGASKAQSDKIQALLRELDTAPERK